MGRKRVVDVAVMLLAAVFGTTSVTQLPAFPAPLDVVAFGLMVIGAGALWFRRASPVAVAWFVTALAVIMVVVVRVWPGVSPVPEGVALPPAAPFAAYALGAFATGDQRRRLAWLPLLGTAAIAWLGAPLTATVGMTVTLIGVPAVLGRYVAARAERAEREHRLRTEQARRDERLRLAAEIHDVVSHRVSVMVLQAGALHLTATDAPTRQAADELRATGCHALDELRDLVGLLNATGTTDPAVATLEPLPDLSVLVEASESVGLAVEVVQTGEPRPLPPVIGRTLYRTVQEALTNTHKHAPGARVRIELCHQPAGISVTVHNTAPTRPPDPRVTTSGGGTGLAGLRRRIELIKGTLHTNPHADGGFELTASLPVTAR